MHEVFGIRCLRCARSTSQFGRATCQGPSSHRRPEVSKPSQAGHSGRVVTVLFKRPPLSELRTGAQTLPSAHGLGSVPRREEPRPPDSRVFYSVKWLWLGFARGCPLCATEQFDPEFCSDPFRTSGSFWAVPNKSVSFLFYVREIISL